jgi:hypothetical protein
MNNADTAQAWIRQRELVEAAMHANGGAPGIPPGSALSGKTGLQVIQSLLSGELPYPHMAQTMDVALIEIGPGHAVFQGAPQLKHYNPVGGGAWRLDCHLAGLRARKRSADDAGHWCGLHDGTSQCAHRSRRDHRHRAAAGHRQSRAQWPADGDVRRADRCAGRQAVRTRHDHLRGVSGTDLRAARGSRVVD